MLSIAIIEDNLQYASALAQYMQESKQFRVTGICHSVEAAWHALRKSPPDIAIIDVRLNGGSGIRLMQQLISEGSQTRFLVLTGYNDDETVISALNAGAHGYLLKGAPPEKVLEAVHELVKGGAPMSALVVSKLLNCFRKLQKKTTSIGSLSIRENEIMQQISRGLLYKEVAVLLGIERETVKKHLSKIYTKLNVQNKIEAMNKFMGN